MGQIVVHLVRMVLLNHVLVGIHVLLEDPYLGHGVIQVDGLVVVYMNLKQMKTYRNVN